MCFVQCRKEVNRFVCSWEPTCAATCFFPQQYLRHHIQTVPSKANRFRQKRFGSGKVSPWSKLRWTSPLSPWAPWSTAAVVAARGWQRAGSALDVAPTSERVCSGVADGSVFDLVPKTVTHV